MLNFVSNPGLVLSMVIVTVTRKSRRIYLRTPLEVGILHHGSVKQLLVKQAVNLGRDEGLQHNVQMREIIGGDLFTLKRRRINESFTLPLKGLTHLALGLN